MSPSHNLPSLDTHAHVAPDVTQAQIATLNGAVVFAMTRDLEESALVQLRDDDTIVWGTGVHPGVKDALAGYSPQEFRDRLANTALVGEIGLDSRGPKALQVTVFDSILEECQDEPVLLSIHSTGATAGVVDALRRRRHPGAILHWFLGSPEEIDDATALGAYFSVNAAMPLDLVRRIPVGRLLPETDFPSARRTIRAKVPGDLAALERQLSSEFGGSTATWRALWHANLSVLLDSSGARTRLSQAQRDALAN